MASVEIPLRLEKFAGGKTRFTIEAHSVRRVLQELEANFPGIAEQLKATTAVAIDGHVVGDKVDDAILARLDDDSEVFFVPAIAGG